jgi:hypothetical protein
MKRVVSCALVGLLIIAGDPVSAAKRKTKKKNATTTTSVARKKGYPEVLGAGVSVPATDATPMLQPASPQAFRSYIVANFAAPMWFPIPDTFVAGQGVEGPIEFINAATRQSRFDVGKFAKPGAAPRFERSLKVSYRTAFANVAAAFEWVRASLAPTGLAITREETDGKFRMVYFGNFNDPLSVDVTLKDGGLFAKTGTSVGIEVRERPASEPVAVPGLFSAVDFPAGPGFMSSSSTLAWATGYIGTDYVGQHSVQFTVQPQDVQTALSVWSDAASWSGPFKLSAPVTVDDDAANGEEWNAPLSYFSRPAQFRLAHNEGNVDVFFVNISLQYGYR